MKYRINVYVNYSFPMRPVHGELCWWHRDAEFQPAKFHGEFPGDEPGHICEHYSFETLEIAQAFAIKTSVKVPEQNRHGAEEWFRLKFCLEHPFLFWKRGEQPEWQG